MNIYFFYDIISYKNVHNYLLNIYLFFLIPDSLVITIFVFFFFNRVNLLIIESQTRSLRHE